MNKKEIEQLLDKTVNVVLATSNSKGIVSTAQMVMVNNGLTVYMQTDSRFQKVKNIKENPNVALNIGRYNFKGTAKILGHPLENKMFIDKLKARSPKTYEDYSHIPENVIIEIKLTNIRVWSINGNKDVTDIEIET